MASRSALDPSPSVIRPATSITVTSPTCRVVNFTLTEYASLAEYPRIYFDTKFLTKVTSVPPHARCRIWNSSISDRIRKMPRPGRFRRRVHRPFRGFCSVSGGFGGTWDGHDGGRNRMVRINCREYQSRGGAG